MIPTRSGVEEVRKCLDSLQLSLPSETQVIVVDDASKDDTVTAVESEFPWVELVKAPHHLGFSGAVNLGAEAARGDVILLLNNDTEVPSGSLQSLLAAMTDYPDYGVFGARLRFTNGRKQWSGDKSRPNPWWFFRTASGLGELVSGLGNFVSRLGGLWSSSEVPAEGPPEDHYWVTGAAMAIRREVWQLAGPMNESYEHYCQDLEFCEKVQKSGKWKIGILPPFLVYHEQGASVGEVAPPGLKVAPEKLLPDYVAWAHQCEGPGFARRVRRALKWGTLLRLPGLGRARYRRAARGLTASDETTNA